MGQRLKIEPLFPFGFGLSYTGFAYQNLKITPPASGGSATVEMDVTNTGDRAGAEVVQLYIGMPSSPEVPQPPKQLKAFQRVNIAPGKTAHVTFALDQRALSYWDEPSHGWKVMPGKYQVYAAASSRDLRLTGAFELP